VNSTSRLVEHFFRHEYGRLVALLTRDLGVRNLELAEDVVQSAMSRALVAWPRSGTPTDPSAWLFRTAKNLAIDILRRGKLEQGFLEAASNQSEEPLANLATLPQFENEIGDETLRLLFLCCHPSIPPDSQVALALKTVSGFGLNEIALGLLTTSSNIEKRLTRAKEKMREQHLELIEMTSEDVVERSEAVLSTIYLIFNEGHAATTGDVAIRRDLCWEAIRLAKMVAAHPVANSAAAQALVALLLLHTARMDGRLDNDGGLVLLAQQDRTRWDGALIREAMAYAQNAVCGSELSRYHIEAAIAWEHCRASDFSSTHWSRIVSLYGLLLERFATPMIRLNAAVARSCIEGPEVGLALLLKLDDSERKRTRPWWDCCMAQLNERRGQRDSARSHWRDALALATADPQRVFIKGQIERLDQCE
jgi:RNA polymerase sigma factor (sigma-70 family)